MKVRAEILAPPCPCRGPHRPGCAQVRVFGACVWGMATRGSSGAAAAGGAGLGMGIGETSPTAAAAAAAHSGAKVERHVQTFSGVKIALLSQLQRQLQFFKRSNKQGRRRHRRRCFSASGVATSTLRHRYHSRHLPLFLDFPPAARTEKRRKNEVNARTGRTKLKL